MQHVTSLPDVHGDIGKICFLHLKFSHFLDSVCVFLFYTLLVRVLWEQQNESVDFYSFMAYH